ncbi:hypothetical protein EJD97_023034 [Solanum chilense]|uniref:Tf2-1-like SH3-like domain-containing protein n=1 Tax=Solanum chilense TaxID=4083 RepID=A0A6N2C311_SOLCI|nr:hypothetical protein EJD97_023034 [Solanum chilense]
MHMVDAERVELASYQLKSAAITWFDQWKDVKAEDAPHQSQLASRMPSYRGVEKDIHYNSNFDLTKGYSRLCGVLRCIKSWLGLCVNAKCQERDQSNTEILKDYNMSILYHRGRAHVVVDAIKVKEKQDQDSILFDLKASVHSQRVLAFGQGGDGVLKYQGRLCIPKVDGHQEGILEEAHSSIYSVHPVSTNMYRDLIEVSPIKGVTRFVKKGKHSPRYIGPYRIFKRVGNLAYELELPKELEAVHPVFYMSIVKKFLVDPSLIVPTENVGIKDNLSNEEVLVQILDRQVHTLRKKEVASVHVLWRNHLLKKRLGM